MKSEGEMEARTMRLFKPAYYRVFGLGLITAALSGCGLSQMPSLGDGGIFTGKKVETASWTPIITEDSMMAAARTNSDGPIEMAAANGCPSLQVEAGQRSVTIYDGNRIGNSRAVIHSGEITKTARECRLSGGMVQVKYGVAGRLVLGPKGKPGTVTLPITMLVFDKTKNQLKTEPFTIDVTITKENPISYFAVVRDVTIPVKQGTVPGDYSISIAFEKAKAGAA
jgi:hypothetical protein